MNMQDHRTETAYWALRLTFGVIPIVAGLDKFTNLLTSWEAYLSPLATRLLPVSPHAFMMAVGVVEIAVGVGSSRATRGCSGGWRPPGCSPSR